jgi:hypothetical protein
MKRTPLTIAVTLALGFLAAGYASAEPVLLNGSFESPVVPPGSVTPGGGTNWTPSDPSGVFLISNGNGIGDTPYGVQFLGLNGQSAGNMFESDSQTIANFEAGVTYVLGVDFADALGGPDPILQISLSGAFNGSQTYTAPIAGPYGSGTIPFTSAVFFFTPSTSGSITVTLTNLGINSAIAVDNVGLYGNANIPEPASIATLLLGAGLLGGLALRRRLQA